MSSFFSGAAPFVGRQDELAQISGLLADPNCRLLTLVGLGGIGKTRLALEAARPFAEARVVLLQPLTSPEFIITAIADAVGFQFYSGSDPKQQLLDYLREKTLLLVLDNCEHLLDDATLLSEILLTAPALRLLVTSRERLNLVEEWTLDMSGMKEESAIALFVQHARRAKVSFALTDDSRSAVVRICRLVGGMPLALELAASWVRTLSCAVIADEIEHSLDILETPARNVEPRHRTMRAAFEPMWERLTAHQRDVFMRLSVFRGGFTRAAAKEVAGASLRTLSALVDKSLVRVDAAGRYDVHELLRQYAAEKLKASGEIAATESRHFAFFVSLAEQASPHYYSSDEKAWLDRFEREHDNFRAALEWCLKQKESELGLRLASTLGWFWRRHLYRIEGRAWLEKMLAKPPQRLSTWLVKTLYFASLLISDLGDNAYAKTLAEQAVTIARNVEDQSSLAWSLTILGHITRLVGDGAQAVILLEEALTLFRELKDGAGINNALRFLGRALLYRHETEQAVSRLEEALALARQAGVQINITLDACMLGNIRCHQQGGIARAKVLFEEGLALSREIEDRYSENEALLGLATVARAERDYERAQRIYDENLAAMDREVFYTYSAVEAFWGSGAVARAKANDQQAQQFYQKGLVLNKGFDLWDTAYCLAGLGGLAADQQESYRAAILLGAAARLFENQRDLYANDRFIFERDVATARLSLSETTFAAAWGKGRSMTLDQVIAYASQEVPSYPETPEMTIDESAQDVDSLSNRELEILRLIADGLSNGEIADQLVLAKSTIKWHIRQIFNKLAATNRTQAVTRARANGLIT